MFFKSLLPALLWALFILIICGVPGHRIPRVDFLDWLKPDKLVHLFVFGVLCFLMIRGLTKSATVEFLHSHPRLWSVLISIAYGALIEVLQATVFIDRSGDVRDALADAIGALIGMWVFDYFQKKKSARHSSS